jgi:large repetitive protein
MPLRPPAGFIRPGFDPLKNPNAPTIGTPTAGNTQVSVAFTPPANVGGSAISAYYAVSNPDRITASGASSPVTVTGLTNGTPYTFQVWALNTYGPGPFSAASGSVTPELLTRGVFGGGDPTTNVIEYINISSTGDSLDFGDLLLAVRSATACASSTRGIFAGGDTGGANASNVIQYITIASTGNAIDFGDIARAGYSQFGTCSSETRGLFAGGTTLNFGAASANINYITIASTGNTTAFGTLSNSVTGTAGCGSTTRGVFAIGRTSSSFLNIIEYVTIDTTGNATDFGDLTLQRNYTQGCSNDTRGLFGGGDTNVAGPYNIIDYVTIASTGNAIDFGDLNSASEGRYTVGACASPTRAVFTGAGAELRSLGYVTITTTGNTTTFGNLSSSRYYYAGLSNCHGGV